MKTYKINKKLVFAIVIGWFTGFLLAAGLHTVGIPGGPVLGFLWFIGALWLFKRRKRGRKTYDWEEEE